MPEVEVIDAILFSYLVNREHTVAWWKRGRKNLIGTFLSTSIFPWVYIAIELAPSQR